jgi:capsular polysaccharide export protein
MRVGLFSISNKHKELFKKLSSDLKVEFIFYRYERYSFRFSIDLFRFFPKVAFKEAIDYSIKFFEAKKDIKVPRSLLRAYFSLELFEKYIRYMLILDPNKTYYIIWNGKKPRHLIAIQIIKLWGIEVRYMENGLLPNRLVFDAQGVNFENSVPRNREFFESYQNPLALPLELIPRVAHHSDKFKEESYKLPKSFIFIPFQVDYDSQILLYSPWIENMRTFFNLIESLAHSTDYNFIIKEHPSSRKDYNDLHQRSRALKNLSFVNGYSTQELIEKSSAILTINSTVGIESLLFKKRVIVVGNAFYTIDGVTKKATNKRELLTIIQTLDSWYIEEKLIENFLKYLYYEYLIPTEECSAKQFKKILFLNG